MATERVPSPTIDERIRRLGLSAMPPASADNAGDAADVAWESPIPLDEQHRPSFPGTTLPSKLAPFVEAVAVATQTPIDLPAIVALGAISAATGGKFVVDVSPGYAEPVNIYALILLESGNRKSSVFRAVTEPITTFERMRAGQDRKERAQWEARRKINEARLAAEQKTAANGEGADATDAELRALAAAEELAADRPPRVTQIIADDVTAEKLAGMLADQGGALAVMSPEGGFFGNLGGRYHEVPALDTLMKAHAGDTIRVNRVKRDAEYVSNPSLTVCIAAQPSLATELGKISGFRQKGAAARFLPSLPASPLGRRSVDPPAIPPTVKDGWRALLTHLLELEPSPDTDPDGYHEPHRLTLSAPAIEELREFQSAIEPRLGEDGDLATISDWGGKVPGGAVRLAALLHLAEHAETPSPLPALSGATMTAAITIATYFTAHARLFFDAMGNVGDLTAARSVWRVLCDCDRAIIRRRDLFDRLRKQRRFRTVDDLNAPLRILQDHGYLRIEKVQTGGRPSVQIAINPLAQMAHKAQKLSDPAPSAPIAACVPHERSAGQASEEAIIKTSESQWEIRL